MQLCGGTRRHEHVYRCLDVTANRGGGWGKGGVFLRRLNTKRVTGFGKIRKRLTKTGRLGPQKKTKKKHMWMSRIRRQ